MKQGARAQCHLRPALRALPDFVSVDEEGRVRRAAALWADKPLRPACALQCRLALGLGSILIEELVQRHTRLKLNWILRHHKYINIICCENLLIILLENKYVIILKSYTFFY